MYSLKRHADNGEPIDILFVDYDKNADAIKKQVKKDFPKTAVMYLNCETNPDLRMIGSRADIVLHQMTINNPVMDALIAINLGYKGIQRLQK